MPTGVYIRTEKTRKALSETKTGFRHPDETRAKMSKSRKGKMPKNIQLFQKLGQEARRGTLSWNSGLKLTDEQKKKQNIDGLKLGHGWNKGIPATWVIGEKNINWRGGIKNPNGKLRNSPEYRLWKKSVLTRDNYTCVWCSVSKEDSPETILHADHIKSFTFYPKLRFDINNGRTLCWDCHKKTDSYGLIRNNNKILCQ